MDHELSASTVTSSTSTTIADPEVASMPDDQKPRVDITDISFSGHVARRWRISLLSTESNEHAQSLRDLPDLDENHARIYDTIARESTSLLASHLGPLFNTTPRNGHSIGSPLDCEGRNEAQGTIRSQWSQVPGSTSPWNLLRIPCTNFLVRQQSDDLKLAPSTALISCRAAETHKVLGECFQWMYVTLANLDTVLYERPYSADKELMSRALGETCPDIFEHSIPPEDGRPRVTFIKLLLLGLFHYHINRLSSICRETFPFLSHEMFYKGVADVPKTVSQIRSFTEFHKHICQLTNMAEFTAKTLEIELEPLGASPKSLMEYILETRYSIAQLNQLSQDNTERYQRGWDAYRELRNVDGSLDVKRLAVFATIFLPLSLASSILAMTTRFADLGPLLYDFVGVSLIIGSLALVLYILIALSNKALEIAQRQKMSVAVSKKIMGNPRIVGLYLLAGTWVLMTWIFYHGMFGGEMPSLTTYLFTLAWIVVAIVMFLAIFFTPLIPWLSSKTYACHGLGQKIVGGHKGKLPVPTSDISSISSHTACN